MAGDVEREGLTLVGALVGDRGRGRAAVADGELEGLADRHAVGVGGGDGDRVGAVVAVGRGSGDDAGLGVDAQAGRQCRGVCQRIAGGRSGEVAGDVEREGLPLVGALVGDRGRGRAAVADRELEGLADRHAVGVGGGDGDRVGAVVAVGRGSGDDAGLGVDAQAGRQCRGVGQRIAGGRSGEVAGDVEREGLTLVGALVGDRGRGRAAVADRELEALADRLAVGVGGGDGDRVAAVVAVGRGSGDDAGLGVDAQAGRQCRGVGQRIAGGRSGEVAGDVEREGLTLVGALVGDRGCGRAAVADGELEGLADRLAVGVGGGDGDRVAAVVAIGRGSGDDAGLGVDAQAGRQCSGVGQRIAAGRGGEVAGDVEREGLTLVGALVGDRGCGRAAVADGELEGLADRLAVGVGGGDGDRVAAVVAIGRGSGDDAGLGVDAQAGRQCSGVCQRIAGGRSGEVAGDVEREGLTLVGALVGDRGCGRAAVADGELEALADRLAVGVGGGDGDRVAAVVAIGRGSGDDAGLGVDAQAGRQCGGVCQRIAGGRSGEVAGDVEREGLTLVGALVGDRGCGRAAVADGELEGLADRLAVGVGGGDGDRVGAVVAIGRGSGDDAGLGVDAQAGRQCSGVCQRIAGGRSGEVAGDVEREGLTLVGALVGDRGCGRAAVADGELEGLADRLAVGVGGGDGDRVAAVVAIGRGSGDDAGLGVDAQAGRQCGGVCQRIAGGRSGEVAGDVEREGLPLVGALVGDRGGGRAAVADRELEALADRHAVGVGGGDGDRVAAVVAVGRGSGDDAGLGVDA